MRIGKPRRIDYSAEEMAWLEANRLLVISDYYRGFRAAFDRPDVALAHLHGLRKRRGWKVGRAKGRTAGRSRRYSEPEIAWLSDNRAQPISEYHCAFVERFDRADVTAGHLHALRKRRGWKTGRSGHFEKGQTSHNKGMRCPPGVGGRHPNARKTQFKKGQLPHNTQYEGHERVSKDGYVEISIAETNPHTGFERRYVLKHRWLWEQKNGPVPDDFALKCLDGDRLNVDPANWEAVPRGVLARLNGGRWRKRVSYDAAPSELKPSVMALAKLEHRIREAQS